MRGLLVADQFAVGLRSPFGQRGAQALFMAAALGRRHGVDVGVGEAVLVARPAIAHSTRPSPFSETDPAKGSDRYRVRRPLADGLGQEIADAAGKGRSFPELRRLATLGTRLGSQDQRISTPPER